MFGADDDGDADGGGGADIHDSHGDPALQESVSF